VSRYPVATQMCRASCDNGVTTQTSGLSPATSVHVPAQGSTLASRPSKAERPDQLVRRGAGRVTPRLGRYASQYRVARI
jgi:hypothetical protein